MTTNTNNQDDFERFAKNSLDEFFHLGALHFAPVAEDGSTQHGVPNATYYYPETEIAWRLWNMLQSETEIAWRLWNMLQSVPKTPEYELASLHFPTMLRCMWSGTQVQQWVDEQGQLYRRKK